MRTISNRAGSAWKVPFIILFALLLASCGDDVTGPSGTGNWFGWAVGASHDHYGMIIATGNGGINWTRQGDGSIPDVQQKFKR